MMRTPLTSGTQFEILNHSGARSSTLHSGLLTPAALPATNPESSDLPKRINGQQCWRRRCKAHGVF